LIHAFELCSSACQEQFVQISKIVNK
jgi:hypothetical protein